MNIFSELKQLAIHSRKWAAVTPLAAALALSACGGGGGLAYSDAASKPPSGQGIAVGEPNPSAQVDKAVFTKMAQGASCSDVRNRLYIIDQAQVFWDVAGNCADASYSYTLFGATPELRQCGSSDSIAGPRTSCADERHRDMFDTILKNRDKADLGLGASHKIELVDLTPQPKLGDTVMFEPLLVNQFSGSQDIKNTVLRDVKEWAAMWQQLNANMTEAPAMPDVDFGKRMLLAIQTGAASNGCAGVSVVRTAVADGVLHVEYAMAPEPGPDIACLAVITSPAAVVAVDKFDGPVSFDQIKATPVKFAQLDAALRWEESSAPFTAVVQDELKLGKLWNQYVDASTPMPKIDFSTQMVLFAWGGQHSSGCYSSQIVSVVRAGKQVIARVLERTPGYDSVCTQSFIASGDFVVLERTDDPVVFAHSTQSLSKRPM